MSNIKVKGRVKRIFYPKNKALVPSGEWVIAAFDVYETLEGEPTLNAYNNISIKGMAPSINYHDDYIVQAKEDKEQKGTYDIIHMHMNYNIKDPADQKIFLERILSEAQINTLYTQLSNPFKTIEAEDVATLTQVKGIGESTAFKIIQKYQDSIDRSRAYVELDAFGLSNKMIEKLIEQYSSVDILIDKIKENPYILANEVSGIGWKRADAMALNSGILFNDIRRLNAFIEYHLSNEAELGNSWVKANDLYNELCANIGDLANSDFGKSMHSLFESEIIIWSKDKQKIALLETYKLEQNIAKELIRIRNSEKQVGLLKNEKDFNETVQTLEKQQGWKYTDEQLEGINLTLKENITIVTGKAGCGKTSVVEAMLTRLSRYNSVTTALSGKAASRLKEISQNKNVESMTIHRLLGYSPSQGFKYDKDNKLPHDIIVVDEVSMLGGDLFYKLVQSIKDGAKLIMLGDTGQLESIGKMNLFTDMIESKQVPCKLLTKIHRQAQKSAIITESLKVSDGKQLYEKNWCGVETRGELQDLVLDIYDDKAYTPLRVMENYKKQLSKYSIKDIMVISPLRTKGDSSALSLNKEIQSYVNPTFDILSTITMKNVIKNEKVEYQIRLGDRIIIKKNNYRTKSLSGVEVPVYNGNLGTVHQIDLESNILIVDMDEQGMVKIPKRSWHSVELGYAITIHSSQGSQSKCVIVAVDYGSYKMFSKELVYTAATRAQELCVICAETDALRKAISISRVPHKQTFLQDMLMEKTSEFIIKSEETK